MHLIMKKKKILINKIQERSIDIISDIDRFDYYYYYFERNLRTAPTGNLNTIYILDENNNSENHVWTDSNFYFLFLRD